MFLFLSLRESQSRPGTIEPDVLPSFNTTTSSSTSSSTASLVNHAPKPPLTSHPTPPFGAYITDWEVRGIDLARKLACILAVCLHIPINVISILSYGITVWLFVGIVLSVLNLVCVAVALWKLDILRGARLFCGRVYTRQHFDHVILGLLLIYGASFAVFVFARMRHEGWVWFFRIVWPCLIASDVFCFVAGWVATWRDVGIAGSC